MGPLSSQVHLWIRDCPGRKHPVLFGLKPRFSLVTLSCGVACVTSTPSPPGLPQPCVFTVSSERTGAEGCPGRCVAPGAALRPQGLLCIIC